MVRTPSTTVGIPLYRSRPWLENIADNIDELSRHALVVVSDATCEDDTLVQLKTYFSDDPNVSFLGSRRLAPGWVSHCNDLLSKAETPFFMWLPHDDRVSHHWIVEGAAALGASPDAVLAAGVLEGVDEPDCYNRGLRIEMQPAFSSPSAVERLSAATHAFVVAGGSLGIVFRGVFRVDRAVALPQVAGDVCADQLWGIAMLERGRFLHLPNEIYFKRWHEGNTHGTWDNLAMLPKLSSAISAVVSPDPAVLESLWCSDREALLEVLQTERTHCADRIESLEQELTTTTTRYKQDLTAAQAQLRQSEASNREVVESKSWRLTKPLRLAAARARSTKQSLMSD